LFISTGSVPLGPGFRALPPLLIFLFIPSSSALSTPPRSLSLQREEEKKKRNYFHLARQETEAPEKPSLERRKEKLPRLICNHRLQEIDISLFYRYCSLSSSVNQLLLSNLPSFFYFAPHQIKCSKWNRNNLSQHRFLVAFASHHIATELYQSWPPSAVSRLLPLTELVFNH
jgi:hypothetical protein